MGHVEGAREGLIFSLLKVALRAPTPEEVPRPRKRPGPPPGGRHAQLKQVALAQRNNSPGMADIELLLGSGFTWERVSRAAGVSVDTLQKWAQQDPTFKAKVGIPEPPKSVSRGGVKNLPLTETERRAYRTIAGEKLSAYVQGHLDRGPSSETPEARAKRMAKYVEAARDAAEAEILRRMGPDQIRERLKRKPAA